MENVIITGGNGFVGSNTVKYFLSQGIKVLSIGMAKTAPFEAEGLSYLSCDIFHADDLKHKLPIGVYDTFIHLHGPVPPALQEWIITCRRAMH